MPKVIRVSFSEPKSPGMVAVVLQEAALVLDLRDEFRTKRLTRPLVIEVPEDCLETLELDDPAYGG